MPTRHEESRVCADYNATFILNPNPGIVIRDMRLRLFDVNIQHLDFIYTVSLAHQRVAGAILSHLEVMTSSHSIVLGIYT